MASKSHLALLLVLGAVGSAVGADTPGRVTNSSGAQVDPEDVKQPGDVCFKALGCFSMASPWWSWLRLVPAPDTPENVGTRFYLFTRKRNVRTLVPLGPKLSLENLDYDGKRLTIFITHGLDSNTSATWMLDMKDALLGKIDANVFLTDWGPGAAGVLKYKQAVSNTRVVSAEMQRLIQHLMKNHGVVPQNIHLIGHSLGAHISAYTGKAIKNIARLTALDPAQPAFEDFDVVVRLDPSDATFVEVIHTDAKPTIPTFGLGMIDEHGHVDYYINGGFTQPGCLIPNPLPPLKTLTDFLKLPIKVISNIVSCPHGRASLVFIEAIHSWNCTFWGHPGNFVENVVGAISRGYLHRYMTPSDEDCSIETCSPMGLENLKYPARGSFVVATRSSTPFCISEPAVDNLMGKQLNNVVRGVSRGVIGAAGDLSSNIPLKPKFLGR